LNNAGALFLGKQRCNRNSSGSVTFDLNNVGHMLGYILWSQVMESDMRR